MFPTTSALLADIARRARRGRVRPARRLHGLHVRARAGVRDGGRRALAAGARGRRRRALADPRLDRPLDLRPLRRRRGRGRARAGRPRAASSASSSARTAAAGSTSALPGPRLARASTDADGHFVKMNGREVFKFATRVLVSSAEELLERVRADGRRRRRLRAAPGEHADHRARDARSSGSRRSGWWSTSTATATRRPGSIPLALAEAPGDGRLKAGSSC